MVDPRSKDLFSCQYQWKIICKTNMRACLDCDLAVVYFDQRRHALHAFARSKTIEKRLKLNKNQLFSLCVSAIACFTGEANEKLRYKQQPDPRFCSLFVLSHVPWNI